MTVRALIVAIEDYPNVEGGALANTLPDTLKAGLAFRDWLVAKWDAEKIDAADRHIIFCSEPVQPDGRAAKAVDIRRALQELEKKGVNQTNELYVYFSGHGLTVEITRELKKSIIITADFVNTDLSSDCCLPLEELVAWLRDHLGPGNHAYFIDACRTVLSGGVVKPGTVLAYGDDIKSTGEPSTFMVQSTVEGEAAAVAGPFQQELMAGLKGKGKAKVWDDQDDDAMCVRYSSLRDYLNERVGKTDGAADGPSVNMTLAWLRPAPSVDCTIRIEGEAAPTGTISYWRGRQKIPDTTPIKGLETKVSLPPDRYSFSVSLDDAIVVPPLVKKELYDDETLIFKAARAGRDIHLEAIRGPAGGGLESLPSLPELMSEAIREFDTSFPAGEALESVDLEALIDIVVPPGCTLELTDADSADLLAYKASLTASVEPGRYTAVLKDEIGQIIGRGDVDVSPGSKAELNLAQWRGSTPHVSIARSLDITGDGWVDFSESLRGPVVDPDLDLWLALAGAGRILLGGPYADYHKLERLPLRGFQQEKPGASPIYVLAGFEAPFPRLKVGLSKGSKVRWQEAKSPETMAGIYEAYFPASSGARLISFRIGERQPYTIATCATPNRATLITLSIDPEGGLRISQYLLPIGPLMHLLPEADRIDQRVREHNQLEDVRFLVRVSRIFRKRRDVFGDNTFLELDKVLYAKWLDPITSALVSYEMLRRGRKNELAEVVWNMNEFFADLPDSAALKRLAGGTQEGSLPEGVPLFLDGLKAYPNHGEWLPLPASHLDYSSPWTAWWGAVK